MVQTAQNFEGKKDKLLHAIAGVLLDALEDEDLEEDEGKEIARFILEKTDAAKSEEDLAKFLPELSQKCPLFEKVKASWEKEVATAEASQVAQTADQQKIDAIKNQLSQLSKTPN